MEGLSKVIKRPISHCVYFRGYDKKNEKVIGHNSYGKYKPLVKIDNKRQRNIEYYDVIITKIQRNDDPMDTKFFYFNQEYIDNLENGEEKGIISNLTFKSGKYTGEIDIQK
jgi:hypothetical protein